MGFFRQLWANVKALYIALVDTTVRDAMETRRLLRFALLCFVVFFLVMGLTFVALLRFGSEVKVPAVAGQDLVTAMQALQLKGLRATAVGVWDEDHPRHQVLAQRPDGGMNVKTGRVVELRVSLGKRELPMPDLKGLTSAEAKSRLLELFSGMDRMPEVIEVVLAGRAEPSGTVVVQSPAAGTRIGPEKDIVLSVSRNENGGPLRCPSFLMRPYATVAEELKALGIEAKKDTRPVARPKDVGRIFTQSMAEGIELQKGDTITFMVGSEPIPGEGGERLRVVVYALPKLGDEIGEGKKERKNRRVTLLVRDAAGERTAVTRYAPPGTWVELPFKSSGAGYAEVQVDGKDVAREDFR